MTATSEASVPRRARLVLADDSEDILAELRSLLAPEFEVVDAVKDGLKLIEAVERSRPDAVVCDIYMPALSGIQAGEEILRRRLCPAIVLLTMHNEPYLVGIAQRKGMQAYVLKEDACFELIPALWAAVKGNSYLSKGVASDAAIEKPS